MATCPSCRKRYPDNVATCEADGEKLLPNEVFSGADVELAAGQMVGEYRIEAKIGEGGFGSVYRAVHPVIGKAAAIKVLNRQYSANPQMVARFVAEARAVNQIRNRNIIDIFSFGGLEDGRNYYVMELLEGMPLDRALKQKGRLAPEEAIPILRGVARALDAAHAAGIAHRDLKPENVFLVMEDDSPIFPKLLDFGIAKLLGDSEVSVKTRTGQPIGTPYYMSPEQCRGKHVDHRTDIYSFGILVHEVLSGRVPFTGDGVMDVLLKQTTADPPALSSVCPDLAPQLDGPVLDMLRKDPDLRPASVGAALEALARAAQEAGYAVQATSAPGLRQSGGGVTVAARSGSGMTPADMRAISDAQTLVDPRSSEGTLQGAAADVAPSARRRTAVLVAAVSLFAGIVGAAAVSSRGSGEAVPLAIALPALSLPASAAAPTPPSTLAPAQSPASAQPEAKPAPPAEVELTIQPSPRVAAEVFAEGKKIGSSGKPLRMKQGDVAVKLRIEAPGYKPAEIEVTPEKTRVVSVALSPIPRKAAGAVRGNGNSDLEF